MDLFIITGGSKGFGAALVQEAASAGHWVLNISRSKIQQTERISSLQQDLKDLSSFSEKLQNALRKYDFTSVSKIHLVNNAAVILPIGDISDLPAQEIEEHLKINLISPILLTSYFLRALKNQRNIKTVTNIISGAAFHPIPSWSLYCASKAGLKMFTENLNIDSTGEKLKFLNFSPGVMDTSMQSLIREQPEEIFPRVQEFRNLQSQNKLRSPEKVAQVLLQLLKEPGKIEKVNYDIKEFD